MIKKLMRKINKDTLHDEAVRFCFDHKNPSVWAFQEVFGLNYHDACVLRTRLVQEGYVELFEKKKPNDRLVVIDLFTRSA